MNASSDTLSKRCDEMSRGIGRAIDWVADVRPGAERLDRDADGLVEQLRRHRNQLRRLGAAARRPMSVGFFGLSQAGKSYLISALASGANGDLETVMDGQRLNFIDHVNPPGGGKEATGLVTRFSRRARTVPAGYPVELKLLSEADIIKILGNTFFCDFDEKKVRLDTDPATIHAELKALQHRRQPQPVPGLTADDVLDVMDYFSKRFPVRMEPLKGDFWPTAIALAPYLGAQDRAQLFAPLFGRVPDLVNTYIKLRAGLERVGHAERVFAPLTALVQPDGSGGLTQLDNIVNVDIMFRLGQDDADRLSLLPATADGYGAAADLPRSLLAALAVEMYFGLADAPRQSGLEEVDLLDFPGYRARLKVESLDDAKSKLQSRDALGELLLRGKVAYLFERYTDDQEMNVLIFCTPSDEQINVTEVADALSSWIRLTQGETPERRAQRQPGLIWAITKFDKRISGELGKPDDLLRIGWNNLIVQVLLERFEGEGWVNDWAAGRPFDNLFLVRRPGMAGAFIDTDGQRQETGLLPSRQQTLADLRRTLLESPRTAQHIRDTAEAWDAMLRPNDGGMSRLAGYLRQVARLEVKLERIAEQVAQIRHDLVEVQLGRYYRADGADAVARKRLLAEQVTTALTEQATFFGELLRLLQPGPEHLRSLYVQAEEDGGEAAPAKRGLVVLGGAKTAGTPATGRAARFAKACITAWIKQLRGLPDSHGVLAYVGMTADMLQGLADEIITGALRNRLEERLVRALDEAEAQAGTTRSRLADQQVRIACMIINEYVDWLGRASPQAVPGVADGFIAPPPPDGLPVLSDDSARFTERYILGWFDAFRETAINNAGHAAGSEITPEQNERMGAILALIADRSEHRPAGA
ncbi:virulence factor SrfC family protein [Oleisolibacter albus]|uniref:virulence factor SrfC family protein n=1 Tax=Oleisolibacter albus TaxID=2171757 RepID=UPI000DF393AC|nr:virulence factor SrfC family protein [Oleisolibacter albus]